MIANLMLICRSIEDIIKKEDMESLKNITVKVCERCAKVEHKYSKNSLL